MKNGEVAERRKAGGGGRRSLVEVEPLDAVALARMADDEGRDPELALRAGDDRRLDLLEADPKCGG